MHFRLIPAIILAPFLIGTCLADESPWLDIPASTGGWENSLPAVTSTFAMLVDDTAATTRLRAWLPPKPLAPAALTADSWKTRTAELLALPASTASTRLNVEWFDGGTQVTQFNRAIQPADGSNRSTYRLGDTTITRTVLASAADRVVFLHYLADKPGALSFRVSIDGPPAAEIQIEDRRQIVYSPKNGVAARVWMIPFESEVATEGRAISIRGEGEALVVWSFATGPGAAESLSQVWTKLAATYDPGQTLPDPIKIWQGIQAGARKSVKNSP